MAESQALRELEELASTLNATLLELSLIAGCIRSEQVTHWLYNSFAIPQENAARIRTTLEALRSIEAYYKGVDAVRSFLYKQSPMFSGQRPISLFYEGKAKEVVDRLDNLFLYQASTNS